MDKFFKRKIAGFFNVKPLIVSHMLRDFEARIRDLFCFSRIATSSWLGFIGRCCVLSRFFLVYSVRRKFDGNVCLHFAHGWAELRSITARRTRVGASMTLPMNEDILFVDVGCSPCGSFTTNCKSCSHVCFLSYQFCYCLCNDPPTFSKKERVQYIFRKLTPICPLHF